MADDELIKPVDDGRDPKHATWIYSGARIILRAAMKGLFDLKAYGVHHIPPDGGVLIASNHQSYLDPPLLGTPLDRPAAFLAKSELFKFGPFGWIIRRLNAFPVRQGAGDVGAMKESIRLLQAGWVLTVFAEGARTEDGELQPVQKGSGLLIRRAKVPVVPAVVDGAFNAWPRNQKVPKRHPVRVLYGEPMDLASHKPDEIRQILDQRLKTLLAELRAKPV
jgi:1-acyl-sn-glycerol-3-phosphate acyltransferase